MTKPKGAIELNHAELTVRLMERGLGLKRPPGQKPEDTLQDAREQAALTPHAAKIVEDFEGMAVIAVTYFQERAADMQLVN